MTTCNSAARTVQSRRNLVKDQKSPMKAHGMCRRNHFRCHSSYDSSQASDKGNRGAVIEKIPKDYGQN